MKNVLILALIAILGAACQKEYVYPNYGPLPAPAHNCNTQSASIAGTWLITGAIMYNTNINTGITTTTNLFATSIIASMALEGKGIYIDTIVQNVTTYTFNAIGTFILNGDTANPCGLTSYNNGNNNTWDILLSKYGIRVISEANTTKVTGVITMNIDERRDSTVTHDYYTQLTLKKIK